MSSELDKKIIDWHERAKDEEDCFAKFIFDYLAFAALINVYFRNGGSTDRDAIQNLKKDENVPKISSLYIKKLDQEILNNLIDLLKNNPIKNVTMVDKWWDCSKNRCPNQQSPNDGKIKSLNDYENIIEFVYRARNNLFHGEKGPNFRRDKSIMKYGSFLLNPLVETIIEVKGIK